MRRDLNTCSSQSAMHHGVRVRVFFRRSSEHHSRNDSSSSTSWSHDVHVFSHVRTRQHFSEGSVRQHPSPCSFCKRVGRRKKNTEQDQPTVRSAVAAAAAAAEAAAAEASSTSTSASTSSSSSRSRSSKRCRKHERTSTYTAVRDFVSV